MSIRSMRTSVLRPCLAVAMAAATRPSPTHATPEEERTYSFPWGTGGDLSVPKSKEGLFMSTFLDKRTVFMTGNVNDESAKLVQAQLLFLELSQPGVPITLVISSGGGYVYPGLGVYDVMQYISSPVHTLCIGHAESMAAVLLAAGEKGHRSALPNGRIMIHGPSLGVSRSSSTDLMIQAKEGENTKRRLVSLLAKHSGRSIEEVNQAIERNNYMTPSEAVQFGLLDRIDDRAPPPPSTSDAPPPAGKATAQQPQSDMVAPTDTTKQSTTKVGRSTVHTTTTTTVTDKAAQRQQPEQDEEEHDERQGRLWLP